MRAKTLQELEDAWAELLIYSQRFFSKLAAGAGGKSQQWWTGVANQRKNDPLLQYAHQARHADEHGIDAISRRMRPVQSIEVGGGQGGVYIENFEMRFGEIIDVKGRSLASGRDLQVNTTFGPEEVRLGKIVNRGVTYEVPTSHLGQTGRYIRPIDLAEPLIFYMAARCAEARDLVES